MKRRIALTICIALAACAQQTGKTSDQATEEGRATNTQYVSDSTLTSKVHTALANDVGMRTLHSINVDSNQGVVTLKGVVDSEDTRQRAESIAKRVNGVSAVKNELRVKGG